MIPFTYTFHCILKQGVAIDRKTRGSCFFGDTGCSTSCGVHGHLNGGCCGSSGGCDGVCYCKGVSVWHVSKLGKVICVWC